MTSYTPDRTLVDTVAGEREAKDLRDEAKRAAMIDEMLSDDGDLTPVIDRLSEEGCEEVALLMRAYRERGHCVSEACTLAVRLDCILESIIDEQMEADDAR